MFNLLTGEQARGGSIELTLNTAAQQAAIEGLAGKKGAVIALDATTGAVLAMASTPSYDPNVLSSHNGEEIRAAFQQLNDDPNKPLLNRSIAETYPPGSTFKVVVAAAALSSGRYQPDTLVPGPAVLDLPQTTATLPNDFSGSCGSNDQVSLTDALRISCNTAFASIGLDLGADALKEQADKFGFDQSHADPAGRGDQRLPVGPQRAADGTVGHRPVRRTRDRPADGDGRCRRGEQRGSDAAVPRRAGTRPRPRRAVERDSPRCCRRRSRRRWRSSCRT